MPRRAIFRSGGSISVSVSWLTRFAVAEVVQARIAVDMAGLPHMVQPFRYGLLLEGTRMRLLRPF